MTSLDSSLFHQSQSSDQPPTWCVPLPLLYTHFYFFILVNYNFHLVYIQSLPRLSVFCLQVPGIILSAWHCYTHWWDTCVGSGYGHVAPSGWLSLNKGYGNHVPSAHRGVSPSGLKSQLGFWTYYCSLDPSPTITQQCIGLVVIKCYFIVKL